MRAIPLQETIIHLLFVLQLVALVLNLLQVVLDPLVLVEEALAHNLHITLLLAVVEAVVTGQLLLAVVAADHAAAVEEVHLEVVEVVAHVNFSL